MKILITRIDNMRADAPAVSYNNGSVEARLTSEACTKYLLGKRGYEPDLIISVCPPIVNYKDSNAVSGYAYYKDTICKAYRSKGVNKPDFEFVRTAKAEENSNCFGNSMYKVRQIIQKHSPSSETCIMLDTSIGKYPMEMMILLLKNNNYHNIELYCADPVKGRISEDNTNHQLGLLEAINEFSEHGDVEKLKACYEIYSGTKPVSGVARLMAAMQSFSDAIDLCQIRSSQEILDNEIVPALEEIENMSCSAAMRKDDLILKLLAENIRRKFGFSSAKDKVIVTPMMAIEWCLKKRHIAPAVTLFVENIPKYLVSTGILKYDHMRVYNHNSCEVHFLYTQLILACCPRDDEISEPSHTEREAEEMMKYMREYLRKGSVSPEATVKIRMFIDTMEKFRKMLGDEKPKSVLKEYVPENDAEKKLIELINKNNLGSFDKLINLLRSAVKDEIIYNEFIKLIAKGEKLTNNQQSGLAERNEIDKKLRCIQNLSIKAIRKNLRGVKINIHRDKIEEFRKFLAYYVYIKKCVRNYISHGNEFVSNLTHEHIEIFNHYSVRTGNHSVKDIADNISDAIRCLDACIINDHSSIRPVKKYYLNIPDEKMMKAETTFPIISIIADSVKEGDLIKVYGITTDISANRRTEEKLKKALDELLIEKDFDYEYEAIEFADINTFMGLLETMNATVSEGDSVYADITSDDNIISLVMMKFVDCVFSNIKNVSVKAVYEKRKDDSTYELYDISELAYVNKYGSFLTAYDDETNEFELTLSYDENMRDEEENIEDISVEQAGTDTNSAA